jgi:hypothetical protein
VRVGVRVRVAVAAMGRVFIGVRVGVRVEHRSSAHTSLPGQSLLVSHASRSSPRHSPCALQRSLVVAALKSSQGTRTTMLSHRLKLSLQLSTVHWMLRSVQIRSVRTHTPATHVSTVQNSPSAQSLPLRQKRICASAGSSRRSARLKRVIP